MTTLSLFRSGIRPLAAALALTLAVPGQDDLGLGRMWTFENPPLDYLQAEYGFRPTPEWLDAVRLASLRFGGGCSASFVSAKGLIMTNHHCVRGDLERNQGDDDWLTNGFVAQSLADERPLNGLTVQQLVGIRDVTAAMQRGVRDGDRADAIAAKQALNQETLLARARAEQPEFEHEIVMLFQGAQFQLYSYKVFEDVRLVVAPHLQAAHFGGDFDNFTFPRFGIDFAFCRAYEDGKPADTSGEFFKWSVRGPQDGELVFVTGNPGSTERLLTRAQLEYQRDAHYPRIRELIDNRLAIMRRLSVDDPELGKQLRSRILSFENAQKAYRGEHEALLDDAFMAAKADGEAAFQAKIASDTELQREFATIWDRLAQVAAVRTALEMPKSFHRAGGSAHIERAIAIVRSVLTGEDQGWRDVPTTMSVQQTEFFVDHLVRAKNRLPAADEYLQAVLGSREPRAAAEHLATTSKVGDDAWVDALVASDGAGNAIMRSDDPALAVARLLVPLIDAHDAQDAELSASEQVLGATLGRAVFAAYGTQVTPDATFTLRFSDGRVGGYAYNGTVAPHQTVLFGMFARSREFDGEYPFDLPQAWQDAESKLELGTAVNFVCTADSTGGNSGSPVINAQREIVGLLFDGNIESLANQFYFRDRVERSVCVHVHVILEALRTVYAGGERVADELLGDG